MHQRDTNSRQSTRAQGILRKLWRCTTPAVYAALAGAEKNDSFKTGDEWFKSVVFSAQHQKKFTDTILHQAGSATEYFEAARVKALQPLMQEIVSTK